MTQTNSSAEAAVSADILRAIWSLFSLAAFSVLLAAVYRNPYLFQDPFGVGLPDLNMTAGQLTLGLQIAAGSALLWALLLGVLGSPSGARAIRAWWHRCVAAENERPRAAAIAAGLALVYAAVRWAANEETLHATLDMLTAGEAKTPFQYRALLPWLARPLTEVFPSLPLAVVYGILEAGAAFGVYVAFALLLRSFVADGAVRRLAALAVFVPLVLNLATPHRYNAIFFPYDTPSVAFFTAGLALVLRRDWWLFYPFFIIATLNRETTCFLAIAYLFLAWGEERPMKVACHVIALALLWLGVKSGLHVLYAANESLGIASGGLFSNQLARSGRILTAVPGLLYIALVTMGGAGAVAFLLRSRIQDTRVQWLFGIVPLFFVGMVIVGELLEVRIYSELIPLVTLALLLIFRDVVDEAAETQIARKRAMSA